MTLCPLTSTPCFDTCKLYRQDGSCELLTPPPRRPLLIIVERGAFVGVKSARGWLAPGEDYLILDYAHLAECSKCGQWWPMASVTMQNDKPVCPACLPRTSLDPAHEETKGDA